MKKLLALALVCALSMVANAAFVISVEGQPNPGEITVMPSDYVKLDIDLVGKIVGADLSLIVEGRGVIDVADITFPNNGAMPNEYNIPFYAWGGAPAVAATDLNGPQFLGIGMFASQGVRAVGPFTVADNIMFHCEEEGDVTITLVSGIGQFGLVNMGADGNIANGDILDTLIIHQIPEPMTMALLGLGGLGLLRRRRR
jgi:hypothetical protein